MTDQRQNRIQSFAFILSACFAFCIAYYFMPHKFNINTDSNAKSSNITNRINPNTAEIESLVRLPDIGLSKAQAIIQYRDNFIENNDRKAFETSEDLNKIKGIGPKTIQNMNQWLKFE